MPLWAVKAVSAVAEKWGVARMRPSTLNRDKYRITAAQLARRHVEGAARLRIRPADRAEEGIRRSIKWYRREGWID